MSSKSDPITSWKCLLKMVIIAYLLFSPIIATHSQNKRLPLSERVKIEFLGWDYSASGYSLSPGEDVYLLFRNNTSEYYEFPVSWILKTYEGEELTRGNSSISLEPGSKGRIPVQLPEIMADGSYMIHYKPDVEGWNGYHPFYFDYHKPVSNDLLNLNLVAFFENVDSENWLRMMLGPLKTYCNVRKEFPDNAESIDAVVIIAEALDFFNPSVGKLKDYIHSGGVGLVFGKTAPVLSELLPVAGSSDDLEKTNPLSLKLSDDGPWKAFHPDDDIMHYRTKVKPKENARVLAEWSDGSPAVIVGEYGEGKVYYISTGSYQVWQDNPDFKGADEMLLRLLYSEKGGSQSIDAMLSYLDNVRRNDQTEKNTILNQVFEGLSIEKPEEFIAVSKGNMGRFGWLYEEGNLTENLSDDGRVSALGTLKLKDDKSQTLSYSIVIDGDDKPEPKAVNQNWLAKSIEWEYDNGEKVTSTLSLGSPAIVWEGNSRELSIEGGNSTHIAYLSSEGIRVIGRGETLDPQEMIENWILTFIADQSVRDMPQLVALTKRPEKIEFKDGISFSFSPGGFENIFISRLYGIRRFGPGKTREWVNNIPNKTIDDARRWSKIFLHFPVGCDEIGWIENDIVRFADKFVYKEFNTDWNTEAMTYITIPPVYILAENAGAPVRLPENLENLNCATKYGPLKGLRGDYSLTEVPLPLLNHRAIVPEKGGMELRDAINRNVNGLDLNSLYYNDQVRYYRNGMFDEDIKPYDISHQVPYNQAPHIDLYKWWLVFNAILTRPVYSDSVKKEVDRHFTTRYWETLNFYPHKSLIAHKREPFTGTEYMVTFVWPTQTMSGFRHIYDINEASGVNVYSYTNYARYYGDWPTLKANWNLCRELHDFLWKTQDWACTASGALESWNVAGLDMLNSEPYGSLTFSYAANNTGNKEDELQGIISGTKSLLPTVARLELLDYVWSITEEGDPWREYVSFFHFREDKMAGSKEHRGSIAFLNTSKGAMHELALAYKLWAPEGMKREQMAMEAAGSNSLCDLTQRLFLGWDRDSLLDKVVNNPYYNKENPQRFQDAEGLYDMAVLCDGNRPVFLSDWAPAEYVSGHYDTENKEMELEFLSHQGKPFEVRIYSWYQPVKIEYNGAIIKGDWDYDKKSGWLTIELPGLEAAQHIKIYFGTGGADIHPYFSRVGE
jgi:hypothetical protein